MLIVLSAVNISSEDGSYDMLRRYVENGGVLIWSVGVARPEHAALMGMNLTGNVLTGRYWKWKNTQHEHVEHFRYVPATLSEGNVSVMAYIPGSTQSNRPLILKHALGNGTVYTSLIPYCVGPAPSRISSVCAKLLDDVIGDDFQQIFIDRRSLQFVSSSTDVNRNVLLSNNDENEWKGHVLVKNVPSDFSVCTELLNGKPLPFERLKTDVETVNIASYDVAIVRCT